MRQTKALVGKIRKLEKRAGLGIPSQIPRDLKTVFFYNQEEDQAPEEIDAKIERQKAELVEKYGPSVLKRLHFIVFKHVSSDREKPSLAP
jgi:hypothetical protein